MTTQEAIPDRGQPPLQTCFDRYASMRADRDHLLKLYAATAPPPSLFISGDKCEFIEVPDTPERAKFKTYIDDLTVKILNGEYSDRMTAEQRLRFEQRAQS